MGSLRGTGWSIVRLAAEGHASMDPQERSRRAAARLPIAHAVAGPPWARLGDPFSDRVRAGEFGTPAIRDWRTAIERISADLSDLQARRTVPERLQRAIAENPRLQPWNFMLDSIFRFYATSTLVLVYRDIDRTKNTVGLRRLLDDIARHPGELTRELFRKLHTGSDLIAHGTADPDSIASSMMGRDLENVYTEFADASGNVLDVAAVNTDIDALVKAAEKVEAVRHTVYAHRAAAGPKLASIDLSEIHALLDLLDRLVNKYRMLLLYQPLMDGHTPVDQTNWPEILTFPWVVPRERDTSVPYAAKPELVRRLLQALPANERRALLREFTK
jgi:hypothetical protein